MSSGVFLGPGESKLHARRNSHVSDMLLMPPSGGAGGGGGSGGSRRSSSFEIPIHGNAHAHYAVPLKEEEVPHSARSDTSDSEAKGHSSSSHLSAGHASATANSLTGTLSHVKSVLMQDPRMAAVLASLRTASATIERTVARLTRVQKHALASLLIASFLLWLFLSLAKGRSNSNSPAPMPPTYDDDYGYERGPKIDWGPGVNGRPACNRAAPWCIIRKGWNDLGPGKKPRLKAVYYNTHGGCERNMIYVFRHFNHKSLVLDIFSPDQISGYGMSASHARAVINSGHVDFICSRYDVVILGDTIPHGRAILASLLEDNPARRCQAQRIIVEMTNRFDWDIEDSVDREEYYEMFRRLVRLSRTLLKGKLLFLANNIADAKYFEFKLGMPVPELKVIRPLGLTDYYGYPGDLPKPDPNVLAAQWHKTHIYGYLREEEGINMSMIPFGHHYGGPHNLLQFKGFVDIPYQYSTMKFYENVAAGVPLLMPSARFVMELGQSGLHQMPIFSPHILHVFSPNSSQVTVYDLEWARYVDYYSPEFEPFVYFFDNYSELRRLSLLPRDEMDSKHVRVKGPAFYIEFRRELYRMWEEVLLAGYSYWG